MNFLSKIFNFKQKSEKDKGASHQSYVDICEFESTEEFWKFITKEDEWYLKYSPDKIKNIDKFTSELENLIIATTNNLREKMEFSYYEYEKIIDWDNFLIRADADKENEFQFNKIFTFKQFCSHCKKEIGSTQRYPKRICNECYAKTTDIHQRNVEFFNTEALGSGCQGYYSGTEQKEKYNSELCYINGKEYFAEEARFGGIVIQVKEF